MNAVQRSIMNNNHIDGLKEAQVRRKCILIISSKSGFFVAWKFLMKPFLYYILAPSPLPPSVYWNSCAHFISSLSALPPRPYYLGQCSSTSRYWIIQHTLDCLSWPTLRIKHQTQQTQVPTKKDEFTVIFNVQMEIKLLYSFWQFQVLLDSMLCT